MATDMTLKTIQGVKEFLTVTVDWLSDASGDASASTLNFNFMGLPITKTINGRELISCQTIPGATTPTDLYDIVVTDINGQDLFGGELANRSDTDTESAFAYDGSVFGSRAVEGALTVTVSNGGNAKTGTAILLFE